MSRQAQGPYLSDRQNEFGVYEIRWTENGRSKRKSTGQADRRAAQRVYAEFLLAVSGEDVSAGGILVARVIDAYLKDKADVAAKATQRNDFGHLKAHFGDLVVSEIDEDDVRGFIAARGQGLVTFTDEQGLVRGGRIAQPKTVRRELGMLSTAIGYCIANKKFRGPDGGALLKPAHKPIINLPAAPPPRDRWLSRDEAAAFLAACQQDPAAPLTREYRYIAMMLYTASRKGAVERLTWDRIDLAQGLIQFRAPGEPVTKKRRGIVPIAKEFQPTLERAYRERTTEFYLDCPAPPYHAWRRAAKRAGLVDPATKKLTVSPHVLRHSWATWAAQDGVALYEIAGVLHDTIATVEKHYAHHCPDHLRGAVNRPLLAA